MQAFNYFDLFECSIKQDITGACLCRTNYTFFKHLEMNPSVPLLVIFFRQLHVADVLVNTDIDKKMGKE